MPTQIVEEQPSTTYVSRGDNSGMTIALITLVSLIVIAIAVLVILHVTTGMA